MATAKLSRQLAGETGLAWQKAMMATPWPPATRSPGMPRYASSSPVLSLAYPTFHQRSSRKVAAPLACTPAAVGQSLSIARAQWLWWAGRPSTRWQQRQSLHADKASGNSRDLERHQPTCSASGTSAPSAPSIAHRACSSSSSMYLSNLAGSLPRDSGSQP